jgi:arylsulfatase A-like enzyme
VKPVRLAVAAGSVGKTVRLLVAAGAATALLAQSGCLPDSFAAERPRDVLLVTVDTLTADRVGCYGDPAARTPETDRLARHGIQVRDAVSPAPLTLPSHATLLTGVDPPVHGIRDNGLGRLAGSFRTVPERMPRSVRRAAFVGAYPLDGRFNLVQGFHVYDDDLPAAASPYEKPERRAAEVFARAAAWLERESAAPARFAWIHVFDPHTPYEAPVPWNLLDGELGAYGSEIASVDRELRSFLQRVERIRGEVPTVLLTSDHGESLGRHGENTHSFFVYDATQRVPLIVSGEEASPRIETRPRGLSDVAPTLLDLCDVRRGDLPGTSLLDPPEADGAYVETRHTELFYGWASLYGYRTPRWKYVRAPRPELYDLAADPGEARNVIAQWPDVAARLSERVDEALAEEVPVEEKIDAAVLEKLQGLGYLATITPGAVRGSGKDPKDHVPAVMAMFEGEKAFVAGDSEGAVRFLREALGGDPELDAARSYLAGALLQLGEHDACIREGTEYLRRSDVNRGPVLLTVAEACLEAGRPAQAVPLLTEAAQLMPGSARAAELLARARARLGAAAG